jgi:acid phosphatase (class A)
VSRYRTTLTLFAMLTIGATAVGSVERPKGYLAPGEFDVTHVIEPAPRPGDPRYDTDRKIFRATRKLVGTPRYALATADVDYSPAAMLRDFSCAADVVLTPQNAPRLTALLLRAESDTAGQSGKAKFVYKRERPYMIDRGQTCQAPSALYDQQAHHASYDYPSGHATLGWTLALILSSLEPDRAQPVLQRGRAFAESRFVCGVHNESAVEAGMLSASATMAIVQTKPEYQADLSNARSELAALRASGERPTACEAEAALTSERVMPRLDPR